MAASPKKRAAKKLPNSSLKWRQIATAGINTSLMILRVFGRLFVWP